MGTAFESPCLRGKEKNLAATYSRGSYTSTTIGKAAFDGRVRDGIGSDHSFMATKKVTIDYLCQKNGWLVFTNPVRWNLHTDFSLRSCAHFVSRKIA